MDGFTVSNANRFLESGRLSSGSIDISNNSKGISGGGVNDADSAGKSFAETLNSAIQNVNELQKSSDKAMQNLATGRTDNVADVMIAAEKADIALKLMVQVRNKMIDAYQEIMKMQV